MNNKLIILVKGNINKFLLKCNINILNIKYISYKEIIITINYTDYNKLLKIYGFKYKILNKKGLIKYKELYYKYKYLIYSFLFGLILLIVLSNIIFDINIICDNKELKSIIKKELSNNNIDKFKFKKSYKNNELIKNNIINKYKDKIEWLEIKNNGVKVEVNVLERKINNNTISDEINNIVAGKSGFIKKIIIEDGVKVIDENNYVNKGDIVISSDIYLNDELKTRVNAKGKIYAEVWYKVNVDYPLNRKVKVYKNKHKKILYFKIGNKYLELFKYKYYDRKNIISINDKLTNISFGIEEIYEYEIINKKYKIEEAKGLSIKKAKSEIEKRLTDEEYIIEEKTLDFNSNSGKINIEVFFSVYEEISKKERVREIIW